MAGAPAGVLAVRGPYGASLFAATETSVWTERGSLDATVAGGELRLSSSDHNGGVYQQFATGGAGTTISVQDFWESNPTASNTQWAEVLVINGSRLPVNGQDVHENDADVVLLYKNDTWATPGGWSGSMEQTAPVTSIGSFVASGSVATIVLKSGNVGGTTTGTRFDDIVVEAEGGGPPQNGAPTAVATATPTTGEAPLAVSFDGLGSSDPDGDALTWSWSFGDGNTGSGATTSHTYATAGTHAATLTVDDGNGGSDTDTLTIVASAPGNPPGGGAQWVVLEERSCNGTCDFDQIKANLNAQGQDIGFVKIGFHVAPTGNQRGLGAWEQTLHDAGVPFYLKSVDSAGQIFEAVQLKAASGCVDNSRDGGAPGCVPHQLVYRRSVTGNNYTPDVPYTGSPDCQNPPPADTPYQQIYNETPFEAAVAHWQRHRDEFPPELEPYKHLIWIETINEINRGGTCGQGEQFPHNVGLLDPVFGQYTKESEWIAEFAIHTSNLAMAEGFNWSAFGWSSGEPEIGSWAGPKMREFLELAAANPARVAVAIHEYSYTTDGLELAFPYQIGRFQEIFDVVDHYGIGRPSIVITEFGWTLNDIPSVSQSMNLDLPWAAELYAPHHEIQGAAIWYLGGGWGGIDNEVQQLIAPLADYATSHYFVLEPTGNTPPPPPPPAPTVVGEVGKVTTNQADADTWYSVTLQNQYANPVVILQPASFNGGQPTTLRLRNVTGTGFELQMDEWDYLDGAHTTETMGYVVLEAGTYTLSGGARVEVGTVQTDHTFAPVTFGQAFAQAPVILSQSQTRDGGQPVVTRQRSATTAGFEVRLQEEDGNDGTHVVESIGYVAIEAGERSGGLAFSAARTPDAVTHAWYGLGFGGSYANPVFLAGMQTQDGGDPAGIRYRSLGATSVEVMIEEETSGDNEVAHTTEVVGYVVFDGPGSLTL